jgi:hypothetical protein
MWYHLLARDMWLLTEGNMLHSSAKGRCGSIGILASKMWFLGKDYVVVPQKDVAAHQGNLFLSTGDVVGQLTKKCGSLAS